MKDYAQALHLLNSLSQHRGRTANQKSFVAQQIDVVRKDAGLPVAVPTAKTMPPHSNVERQAPGSLADCGPRALAFVCNRIGVRADLDTLRRSSGTTADGTTMEGLAKAAKRVGLEAEGIQTSREGLPGLKMPAIAWYRGSHFVAVLTVSGSGDDGKAVIRDPNVPQDETIPTEALLRRSGGYLLLVHRP